MKVSFVVLSESQSPPMQCSSFELQQIPVIIYSNMQGRSQLCKDTMGPGNRLAQQVPISELLRNQIFPKECATTTRLAKSSSYA